MLYNDGYNYHYKKKWFNRGYLANVHITIGIDLINGGFF